MITPTALERLNPVCPVCGQFPETPRILFVLHERDTPQTIVHPTSIYTIVCQNCGKPFRAQFYAEQRDRGAR